MRLTFARTALIVAATACFADSRPETPPAAHRTPASPPGFHEESVALDRDRNRIVMFGGLGVDTLDANNYAAWDLTYEWNGSAWEVVHTDSHPSRRGGAIAAYDPGRKQVLLFGGLVADSTATRNVFTPCPTCGKVRQLDDVWTYDGNAWHSRGNGPLAFDGGAVYDVRTQRVLMTAFIGLASGNDGPKRIGLWSAEDARFTLLDSAGPRSSHASRPAFDAKRGVLVVPILEGPDAGVWEWNGMWKRVTALSSPPPRGSFVTTYDEGRERVILFGGAHWADPTMTHYNDLWAWDGASWTRLHDGSGTAPAPREDGTLIYEPSTKRLLLVGGLGKGQTLLREMWAFEGSAWSRVQ